MPDNPLERCNKCYQKKYLQTHILVNPDQEPLLLKTSRQSPVELAKKVISADMNSRLKYGDCADCPFFDYSQ